MSIREDFTADKESSGSRTVTALFATVVACVIVAWLWDMLSDGVYCFPKKRLRLTRTCLEWSEEPVSYGLFVALHLAFLTFFVFVATYNVTRIIARHRKGGG